jgi:hypothetical protein
VTHTENLETLEKVGRWVAGRPSKTSLFTGQHRPRTAASLRFKYTSRPVLHHTVCVDRDRHLDVVGDASIASYEWVLRDNAGDVLRHSDCGYGVPTVALRDGLVAFYGLPDTATLRDQRQWATLIARGDTVAQRFMLEALATFAANGIGPSEAGLYWLLLSSRGYVGSRLREVYQQSDCVAARALNRVVREAIAEMESREGLWAGPKIDPEELEERDLDRR